MKTTASIGCRTARWIGLGLVGISALGALGQPARPDPAAAAAMAQATAVDHQNMMEQLGITVLRPGANSRAGTPNAANYDEEKANAFTELPDALTLKNGEKVTTAEVWWKQRRGEIVEDFEREVVGRVPREVPKVTWTVTKEVRDGVVGTLPVVGKQLVGHVDNSGYPPITVEIQMTLVTPPD
jgi:hypothetical protein